MSRSKRCAVAIAQRLPEGLVVQSSGRRLELAEFVLRPIELALRFAGALSMLMAAFIILNTVRMNFGERRRDMGVVRMLGATSRQMAGLQLLEGVCLGLGGSLLGIPLGIWLGQGLGQLMGLVLDTGIVRPQIDPSAIAVALVLGPLVACIAALVACPAIEKHFSHRGCRGFRVATSGTFSAVGRRNKPRGVVCGDPRAVADC